MAEFRFLLSVQCHATAPAFHKCVCSSTTPWPISFQLCGSPSAWFHIFISSFKGTIFSLIRALSLTAQQVHDVEMTLYWCRCDIITSHWHQYNVILTSCVCWEGNPHFLLKNRLYYCCCFFLFGLFSKYYSQWIIALFLNLVKFLLQKRHIQVHVKSMHISNILVII